MCSAVYFSFSCRLLMGMALLQRAWTLSPIPQSPHLLTHHPLHLPLQLEADFRSMPFLRQPQSRLSLQKDTKRSNSRSPSPERHTSHPKKKARHDASVKSNKDGDTEHVSREDQNKNKKTKKHKKGSRKSRTK